MKRCDKHNDEIDRRFDALRALCLDELEQKQKSFVQETSRVTKWHYDLDQCTLTLRKWFSRKTYDIMPIGIYVPEAEEWCWAWANDAFPATAIKKAEALRELYAQTNYNIFDSALWTVRITEVDELCAIALHHLNARGLI